MESEKAGDRNVCWRATTKASDPHISLKSSYVVVRPLSFVNKQHCGRFQCSNMFLKGTQWVKLQYQLHHWNQIRSKVLHIYHGVPEDKGMPTGTCLPGHA